MQARVHATVLVDPLAVGGIRVLPGSACSTRGCSKNAIGAMKDGVATRGVLVDLPGTYLRRQDVEAWEKKSGVKIVNANPELVAEVKKRSAPIIDDWITKASAKGVDATKILAEFREELKKVAAGK